jgi:Domain of unknown function (DUF4214)
VYNQVLDRSASSTDSSYWLSQLVIDPRSTVATDILDSTEARAIAIEGYYHTILGRTSDPSTAEVAYWATSALSLEEIRIAFESSPEYSS